MTTDKALDLALEALIDASGHVNNETFVKVMRARDAINDAIKQARSAPYVASPRVQSAERGEPVAWGNLANWCLDSDRVLITDKTEAEKYHRDVYDLTPLYTAPPAAQPTAEDSSAVKPAAPVQEPADGDELTIAYMSGVHRGKELAAQRQWVGLNWGDMPDIRAGDHAFLSGAQWAEAKLKERNT
jgi:hypothetical protein